MKSGHVADLVVGANVALHKRASCGPRLGVGVVSQRSLPSSSRLRDLHIQPTRSALTEVPMETLFDERFLF